MNLYESPTVSIVSPDSIDSTNSTNSTNSACLHQSLSISMSLYCISPRAFRTMRKLVTPVPGGLSSEMTSKPKCR